MIALVVTIVVLLILAAVAINLTIGNNGIFTRAQNAVEEYGKKGIEEEVNMYWVDAQMNYEDTIEEQVAYLQEEMRKQDSTATATVNGEEIDVIYKGQNIKLKYENPNKTEKINYFSYWENDNSIIKLYKTENEKIYVEDENNKICLNDKYPELNQQGKLKVQLISSGSFMLHNNKRIWNITVDNIQDIKLEKELDLETMYEGNYKEKNILTIMEAIILDDGKIYGPGENQLEEINLPQLENIKISDYGTIESNSNIIMAIIDQNGKIYDFNTGDNISSTYANGFFLDKKITNCTTINIKEEIYNSFITDEGKLYLENVKTQEVIETSILNNKKIDNVYLLEDTNVKEIYTAIITEDGNYYYTEDFQTFYDINKEGVPKLTIIKE